MSPPSGSCMMIVVIVRKPMPYRPDIVASRPSGELILVVEVKSRLGTGEDWARVLRRNLLAHGGAPSPQFFLLALPDRFYLWTKESQALPDAPPDHVIDPREMLSPYLSRSAGLKGLSGQSFELVIASLLQELASGEAPEGPPAAYSRLRESGLVPALKDTRLAYEAAA